MIRCTAMIAVADVRRPAEDASLALQHLEQHVVQMSTRRKFLHISDISFKQQGGGSPSISLLDSKNNFGV